jgi:hypothetical protein
MVKLIVGVKGTGKTKTLIDLVNKATEESKGSVICIEKGSKLNYDITHKARLIDTESFMVSDAQALYGFIAVSGLKMLQKVDLEQNRNLFVASTILIAGIGGLTLSFGKVTITSIACALILGIIVNVILSKADKAQ